MQKDNETIYCGQTLADAYLSAVIRKEFTPELFNDKIAFRLKNSNGSLSGQDLMAIGTFNSLWRNGTLSPAPTELQVLGYNIAIDGKYFVRCVKKNELR